MPEEKQPLEQEEAILLGKKLGIFISALPLDDAAKAEMVKVSLAMSPEELAEFVSILEAKYADFKTQELDVELEKNIAEIKAKFVDKRKALSDQVLTEMADLEKEFDNL